MKRLMLASFAAVCSLAAASTMAASYSPNGTHIPVGTPVGTGGPTSLTYAGTKVSCHSTFYANVPGSKANTAATVDSAEFRTGVTDGATDSSLCPQVKQNGVWTIAAPTSKDGPNNVTITNVSVTVPSVVTCTGSVTGTLTNGNFNFSGTLQATTGGTCGVTGSLQTSLSANYP